MAQKSTGKMLSASEAKHINPKVIRFFSALANETRLSIVTIISEKPITVNNIHKQLESYGVNITLSGLSHQLKELTDLGILNMKKKGREKYFMLSDQFCWCIVKDAFSHFDSKVKCQVCIENNKNYNKI